MIKNLKFLFLMTLLLSLLSNDASAQGGKAKTKSEKTEKTDSKTDSKTTKMDSLSYGLGVLLGQNIKQLDIENIDAKVIAQAIQDVLDNNQLKVTPEQANMLVSNEMAAAAERKAGPAIEEGRKFLAENAKKPGIKTTASGLQYEVIQSGKGATPKLTDKVTTHYRGTLINGNQFDSSYDRGEPATFPVNGVIKGWTEALQLMKEGDKWRLYIPYNLAYGERGAGHDIPPYATLIFDIELIKVN